MSGKSTVWFDPVAVCFNSVFVLYFAGMISSVRSYVGLSGVSYIFFLPTTFDAEISTFDTLPALSLTSNAPSLMSTDATAPFLICGEPTLFRMPFQEHLIGNPFLPALHGGVVAGFAETAATLHLILHLKGAKFPKSIDFSIDYLRSGRPQETFASSEIIRVGSRVALVQTRCWQKRPEEPIVVTRAHFLLTDPDPQMTVLRTVSIPTFIEIRVP